jgi:PRTRC genetic system ThiF family protein
MTNYHYVPAYFVHPTNPITIDLVGVGGTGSLLLTRLVQLNASLLALGMKGIFVRAWDPDKFSEANVGRQNMAPSDVDRYKAEVLISRINRTYGFAWAFENKLYGDRKTNLGNILITCVDSGKARKKIYQNWCVSQNGYLREQMTITNVSPMTSIYWMDLGNARYSGQIILGSRGHVKQPGKKGKHVSMLPHVLDVYPDIDKYDKPDEPSCSVAESLRKQSLMMNTMMAAWGGQILTDMLMTYRLSYQGVYINLKTYNTNPIPIKPWNSGYETPPADLSTSKIKRFKEQLEDLELEHEDY